MKEIKFRVAGNIYIHNLPDSSNEFDTTYGAGTCVDAATKEMVRQFQTTVRGLLKDEGHPTSEELESALNATTPTNRQTVGGTKKKSGSVKKAAIQAIARAVENDDMETAKELFRDLGFSVPEVKKDEGVEEA